MSLLNPVPRSELGTTYTHYGWFVGLVPVYVSIHDDDAQLAERNWVPEWYFWLAELLFSMFCEVAAALNPEFESGFPILITGRIES